MKKHRILLLNPEVNLDWFTPAQITASKNTAMIINTGIKFPTEFFHISAILKKQGDLHISMIDPKVENLSLSQTTQKAKEFNPDIVLLPTEIWISARCNIPYTSHVKKTIHALRQAGVDALFVVSGPHGTIFPKQILADTGADVAIQGEPELTFIEIVNNQDDLASIKGISFTDQEKVIVNEAASLVDMKEIIPGDFSLFPVEKYFSNNMGNAFPVISTRGCTYSCSYCAAKVLNKQYRERALKDVFKEIDELTQRGLKKFAFQDEIFTANKRRTFELCTYLEKHHPGIEYIIQTRSEFLNDELMAALKRSGCTWIGVGFESAVQEVLDKVNKKGKVESVENAIRLGKKHNLTVHLFAISLLPGDNKETIKKTMDFFKRVKPVSISIASATPIPGTQLWQEGIDEGILKGDSYNEALSKTGMVGTGFDSRQVSYYDSTLPVEISFSSGNAFIRKKLSLIGQAPVLLPHYIKKMTRFFIIKTIGKKSAP
jgi:anaerobic magnesium-protoporphyrin IX monomethyl ester cyclase